MLMTAVPLSALLIVAIVRSTAGQSERIVVPVTFKDNRLYGNIAVGKSKNGKGDQVFTVDFNTRKEAFWLASVTACPNSDCSSYRFRGFDGQESASYKTMGKEFPYKFDSGAKIMCNVIRDQYKLGSGEKTLIMVDQKFGEAPNMDPARFCATGDGVFGLSLVSKKYSFDVPVSSIAKQPNIEPVFSFYIKSHQSQPADLIIGGKDGDLIDGELNSHNVVKSGNEYDGWLINIDKLVIKWKDGSVEDFVLKTKLAEPSPSNLLIDLPPKDNHRFNKKLFARSQFPHDNYAFSFSCNDDWASMPDVVIVLDGREYEMSPKDYIVDRMERERCSSGFSHRGDSDNLVEHKAILLGQIFLKKFYTRFNIGTKQIQIANAKRVQVEGDPRLPMGATSTNH